MPKERLICGGVMEKIDIKEINLGSMSKLQHNGASSDIYIIKN